MTESPVILFDAGGTLVVQDPAAMSRILGFEIDPGAAIDAHYRTMAEFSRLRLDGRDATWDWWLERYFSRLGHPEPEYAGAAIDRGFGLWRTPLDGVESRLEKLARTGSRMAVVSNSDGSVEDSLAAAGLARFFEFILDSEVVGAKKPQPEIFLAAVRRLGVDPAEALYVGDSEYHDVRGAQGAGLGAAILVDPFDLHPHVEQRIRSVADLGAQPGA